MHDVDIRAPLRAAVQREHAPELDTAVIEELGIRQGQARVDLAVVNGVLKGYEIKSAADTLRRLPLQVRYYGQVLDRAELVLEESHREHALAVIPSWWGVTIATRSKHGRVRLDRERQSAPNEHVDPRALAELLWHDDVMAVLSQRGEARGLSRAPRAAAWDRLAHVCTRDEIAAAVRTCLKARAARPPERS